MSGGLAPLDIGQGFAYKQLTAHGGNPIPRRKTMASKEATKKLKKAKALQHTKTLMLRRP
jgi:hypothetical protein